MPRLFINCSMCSDTRECPECDPDEPADESCTMCFGRNECPERCWEPDEETP